MVVDAGDQEFEPSADMLIHDFDDEQTLAEEEAIAIAEGEDPQSELNDLQKVNLLSALVFSNMFMDFILIKLRWQESDMPLEELLALYPQRRDNGAEAQSVDGKLQDDEVEDMEEDEEDGDDESIHSTTSSSSKSKTPAVAESQLNDNSGHTAKASTHKRTRSDLHLLYSNEEEAVPEARLLRSAGAGNIGSDEDADEEDDQDYAPGEDEWRKVVYILDRQIMPILIPCLR